MGVVVELHAIDWARLARAIEFYKSRGWTYIEAPWAVDRRFVDITCPRPELANDVENFGTLVGSAEQSFLALDLAGQLPPGMYVALTPCFRIADAQAGDPLHQPYFMKVELYRTEVPEYQEYLGLAADFAVMDAQEFFLSEIGRETDHKLEPVLTDEGVDLELNGVEVGSYGVRHHGEHSWVCGTGLAEPRFSQALRRRS